MNSHSLSLFAVISMSLRRKENIFIRETMTYLYEWTLLVLACIVHKKIQLVSFSEFEWLACYFFFFFGDFYPRSFNIFFGISHILAFLYLEIFDLEDNKLFRNSNSWRRPCCAYLTCMFKLKKKKKVDVGLSVITVRIAIFERIFIKYF